MPDSPSELFDAGAGAVQEVDASAGALAATSGKGATLVANVGSWSVVAFPATNTAAAAVKAAGATGVRHVCTGVSFSLSEPATALAFQGNLQILDGATIIWQHAVSSGAGTSLDGISVNVAGLSLVGSPATSMTAQWSAAAGTATQEAAVLMGYDAS